LLLVNYLEDFPQFESGKLYQADRKLQQNLCMSIWATYRETKTSPAPQRPSLTLPTQPPPLRRQVDVVLGDYVGGQYGLEIIASDLPYLIKI